MKLSLLLLSLTFCTGCSLFEGAVPKNSITISGPSGKYDIETPKNVCISQFKAAVETNGLLTISFDKWCSTNDAMVIDKAGAARVMEIQAWADLLKSVTETAIKATGKAAVP